VSRVTPFLWFDGQAEEAAVFYVSLFPDSRIVNVTRSGAAGPGPEGAARSVTFELDGRPFIALNGGPHFKFSEAVSFSVSCSTQEEVDRYWNALSEGGQEGRCGWLKDRWGLSWQVTPTALGQMLSDPDPSRSRRTMEAMLQMKKLDIEELRRAYEGRRAG
jgi:predicted 3-demethylubiquinone-9 3-methyltransferase (glyoxalase superfamily)